MTAHDLLALLPLLIAALTAVAVLLVVAVRRSHTAAALVSGTGLAAALASILAAAPAVPLQVTPLLVVDPFGLFYTGLILAATVLVVVFSHGYFEHQSGPPEAVYVLLPAAAAGAITVVLSSHFASFFLGLEVLSIALSGLIGSVGTRPGPVEAGLKYLVPAAGSTAALVFGMALIYARLGTMEFGRMTALFTTRADFYDPMLLAGLALIITGIAFRLAVAPFHIWAPDVYEGAPAPMAAFVDTVSKVALFGLLLRYFRQSPVEGGSVFLLFTILAMASMIAGTLLVLRRGSVKHMLACASIAHFGYFLVAFQAGGAMGAEAATFYLTAYVITTLGAFGVVGSLSNGTRDADRLDDYRGLFWRRPFLAGVLTAMMLSLAGIPLTAGFLGRYFVVAAGASAGVWSLLIVLMATSVIGLFGYLRVVVVLYARGGEPAPATRPIHAGSGLVLTLLTVLLVWFGTWPVPLLTAIRTIFTGFV
ncbi:MAG TPA: NADH-quinone oxidoreductase subunit N [Vicinamibacterales bacterium]|nr:NADH-quinone oxidoreductase subunit N [Vicinamibacterales bacterium]